MKPYLYSLCILPIAACASIIEGSTQNINLQTNPPLQANCRLSNERGVWQTSAPAMVQVKRSKSDLNVDCRSSEIGGTVANSSDAESWTLANLALGGLIGLGVDAGTGAMFSYDDAITVPLGERPQQSSQYGTPYPYAATTKPYSTVHGVANLDPIPNRPLRNPQQVIDPERKLSRPSLPQPAQPVQAAVTQTAQPAAPSSPVALPRPATRPIAPANAVTVGEPTSAYADPYAPVAASTRQAQDYLNASASSLSDIAPAAGGSINGYATSYAVSGPAQATPTMNARPTLLPLPASRY